VKSEGIDSWIEEARIGNVSERINPGSEDLVLPDFVKEYFISDLGSLWVQIDPTGRLFSAAKQAFRSPTR
jgi:hypothetical protein